MNIKEIRALDSAELKKKLQASEQELFNLHIRLTTKQLVNHREIPRVKKDIARIETVLKERLLAASQSK
ncbi:MAG: 50S ribosomal protein L29 [Dehalococcoidales bacterium]|nr:50S ribosomal protein L29 [Dehalococcoidales bacterium]